METQLATLKLWTPAVRSAWQIPNELTVSQWADKYRKLDPMISAEPGQWRTDRTPYLRGIMDSFNNPLVEKITIMSCTQVGKTESWLNMLAYIIDQDPAPALVVMPREPDAKYISKSRIRPMIEVSPELSKHLTNDSDDITKLEMRLNRMFIYFAGANSPAALSGKPVRYVFRDEVDKYPKFSGEEADPIKLSNERTHTFWNRKSIDCSTPTTKNGYIYREYEHSDKRSYYVPCPYCGGYQVLEFEHHVKFPKEERDPERIRQERLAWYECEYCQGKITDLMKQDMLLKGKWIPAAVKLDVKDQLPDKLDFPQVSHVGFHLNALYSPWLTFSDVTAEFIDSHDRPELLMNFINSWLAQVWEEKAIETKPEKLKILCGDYARGTVPDGAIVLFGGVDMQKDYFIVIIRAWGAYPQSWLILEEKVNDWNEVENILFKTQYPSVIPGIEPFSVRLTCFDTGYRTGEVYNFCRQYPTLTRAIKGKDQITGVPYKMATIDKYPDGKHIKGGLKLWFLDTNYFKDKISFFVHTEHASPTWHLHKEPSEEYFRWFCGEHKIIKRDRKTGRTYEVWEPVSSHAQAHYWDAEVYAMAAAEMMRVFTLKEEDRPKPQTEIINHDPGKKPESWIGKKPNWIKRNG
ncbi:MAG: phage terminase large subunit family protein [Candidatus Omnitrophica bacterium]|nr:phage terminase large subunit family protein [Candidatus Omnitrophota bacterium]MDD5592661.1 phage terminase large subunit family protein [Candidatus Omnitrophota bacterium]